ncbi:MAG: hypothetical protein LUD72_10215 [Bacteroidales bacterium]|nr:hypothetical protein [Bacteroidales bacterium]
MLKYSVCRDNFLNKDCQVQVLSSEKRVMLGENGDTKKLLVCECESTADFNEGMEIVGLNTVSVTLNTYATMDATYEFSEVLEVSGVNSEESTISFLIDKYIELPLSTVALQIIGGITYAYLYFSESHYFNDPSFVTEEQIRLYLRYGKLEEDVDIVPNEHIEWINISTLRIQASYLESRCPDSYYAMFEGVGSPTESEGVSGRIDNVVVMRDTFLYEYDEENDEFNYQLYFDRPVQVLKIPLSQEYSTNLFKEIALKEDFVDVEREKAINKIVDTEKVVYYPVIKTADGYDNVYKIIFNFHFREHRGDDWTVEDDSYWNGTYADQRTGGGTTYPSVELMRASSEEQLGYFSYKCKETKDNTLYDESYQSDLLSYLGFVNDDVRYQKNKLKKSFIRLSFYDSTNPANQNLLGYSTVFVDSGKLFSRYSAHFEDKPYSYLDSENISTDIETKLGLTGIRVNREPYDTTVSTALSHEDYLENARLSSQLVVQDKYNSASSSEGFYLYLWRSSTSPEPQDIYMKVEYNHAGYGRSLPMMMPYFKEDEIKPSKAESNGMIKTFDEILDDWNIVSADGTVKEEDVGYGVRQYLRYSYIHFKYQYDVATKQCVYYLDNEQYGYNNLSTSPLDGTLVFNLYEAKIGAQNADDGNIVTYCYGDESTMTVELSYNIIPATGGTVKPQITFSLPVYECGKENEGPIKFATQSNSTYTVTFSGCEDYMDESGAVTAEPTEETDRTTLCEVTAMVTVGGVEGSAVCKVEQLGIGDETFRYTDVVLSLEYPTVEGCGGTVDPLLSYSYNRTSSYGECIYVEHVYRELEEGETVVCGAEQAGGTYLFYRWCECDKHYDDDVVWNCLTEGEKSSYDIVEFEFGIDNDEFVDDNSEEEGGTGDYGINPDTGTIRVDVANSSGNMASLGTVTVTMECGTGTYRDKCEVYQDVTDLGESDYKYQYCYAQIITFEYNNGEALPSLDGVYYPTLVYSIPYTWDDCYGETQSGTINEGGEVEYSFDADPTSAANSDPELEDTTTGKLVVGTADERGEGSTETETKIGTVHVTITLYDDNDNPVECEGEVKKLTADYDVLQSLDRDICSYGSYFATLEYPDKIAFDGGESCPTLVCGQNVTYCNGAPGTTEITPTSVAYDFTPSITNASIDSVTGCVTATIANEGLDDRLVGVATATVVVNGETITTGQVSIYQEGETCVYDNPEIEIEVRNG